MNCGCVCACFGFVSLVKRDEEKVLERSKTSLIRTPFIEGRYDAARRAALYMPPIKGEGVKAAEGRYNTSSFY